MGVKRKACLLPAKGDAPPLSGITLEDGTMVTVGNDVVHQVEFYFQRELPCATPDALPCPPSTDADNPDNYSISA